MVTVIAHRRFLPRGKSRLLIMDLKVDQYQYMITVRKEYKMAGCQLFRGVRKKYSLVPQTGHLLTNFMTVSFYVCCS